MARPTGFASSSLVIALTVCFAATPASSADARANAAESLVLDCASENLPKSTSVQKVVFESKDRVGNGRSIVATVSWKRMGDGLSRVLVRVHEPDDMDGAALLLVEKKERADMFIYLPDLKKVKRVTSRMLSGSLFGSDFTYEDFMNVHGMGVAGRRENLEGSTLDGIPVRVIANYPAADAGSAYERVVSYWDAESCLPLKTEMYEGGDRLRKVLTLDRTAVFSRDHVRIPQNLLMEDRRDGTSTRLLIDEIEIDVDIPRKTFSTSHLERGR